MPIIKSAIKRVRQSAKRRSHNLQVKRAVHNDIRAFEDALASGDTEQTVTTLKAAISEIDRAVKKGTLHRNTAGRRKSKLTKAANPVVMGNMQSTTAKPKAKVATKPQATAKPKTATKKAA